MKITKEQLKQIIKEEIRMVMKEQEDYSSNIEDVLQGELGLTFEEIGNAIEDLQVYGDEIDMTTVQEDLETLMDDGTVVSSGAADFSKDWSSSDPEWNSIKFSLASLEEQEDANQEIDKAQVEAQKIAGKLASELESVSETSGLDVATLASLVSQFIDQEIK